MFQMTITLTFYLSCVACTEVILHDRCVSASANTEDNILEKIIEEEKWVELKSLDLFSVEVIYPKSA